MLNWLFGRKKKGGEKEPPKKKEDKKKTTKKTDINQPQDQWIYDALLQYLTSPLWKIPISMFMDENCLAFDDEEQNHFEYTDIHNKFKKMIEEMLDTLIIDIGITYDQFLESVKLGMTQQEHRKIFEQLLVADNFVVFKKLLVKRNKELELEAIKDLQEEEKKKKKGDSKIEIPQVAGVAGVAGVSVVVDHQKLAERAQLESYEKEIEHAIAMSLAVEQEKDKINRQEQDELEKVLALSKIEYERQQSKISEEQERAKKLEKEKNKQSEEEKKKLEKIEENRKKLEEEKQKMLQEQNKKQEVVQQLDQKKEDKEEKELNEQKEEQKQEKHTVTGPLAPLKQTTQQKAPENTIGIISSKMIESEIVIDLQKREAQIKQEQQLSKEVLEEKKIDTNVQFKPPMQYSVIGKEGQLPQVNPKKRIDPMTLDELMNERMALKQKLESMKQEDDATKHKEEEQKREEDLFERKKRLQQQRDLILKKKKNEQEKELINYKMKQQLGMLGSLPQIGQQSLALGSQSIKQESEQDVMKEKNKQLMSKIQEGLKE